MKFLTLSEQDRQLLLHLQRHIYLSKEFIDTYIYNDPNDEAAVKAHERSVYRRLNKLEEADYIISFPVPIKKNSKRPSNIYTLTKFGVDIVKEMTGDELLYWQSKWSLEPQIWYMHTLTLAEVVKNFEIKAPKAFVVKEFIPETRAHYDYYETENGQPKRHCIRPDGILVIGPPNSDENWGLMLEMERSYGSRAGSLRKLAQYNHFFRGVNSDKEYEYKAYQERMAEFDLKIAFEHPVDIDSWRILFIGNNDSMGDNIINSHLRGQQSEVKLVAAPKDAIINTPYENVYRSLEEPEVLGGF